MTSRQLLLMQRVRGLIAAIGEKIGEESPLHLNAREIAAVLEWYLENMVIERKTR